MNRKLCPTRPDANLHSTCPHQLPFFLINSFFVGGTNPLNKSVLLKQISYRSSGFSETTVCVLYDLIGMGNVVSQVCNCVKLTLRLMPGIKSNCLRRNLTIADNLYKC